MHHIRLIEPVKVHVISAFPDMDVRGLGQCVQQFVSGMCCINCGPVMCFRITAHGMMIPVHPVETCISIPCFIEMKMIHTLFQFFLDPGCIIADPVIGTIGQNSIRRLFRAVANQRRILDLLSDCGGSHF